MIYFHNFTVLGLVILAEHKTLLSEALKKKINLTLLEWK